MGILNRSLLFVYTLFFGVLCAGIVALCLHIVPERVVLNEYDYLDMDIYLHHGKAGHGLNSVLDLLLHGQCHIRDAHAELHDDVQINSSLGLSYLNLYSLGKILLAENLRNAANQSAAEMQHRLNSSTPSTRADRNSGFVSTEA